MFEFIRDTKNDLIEKFIKEKIDEIVEDFGDVLYVEIDTVDRVLHLEVELEGENEPIEVTIAYDIEKNDDYYFIVKDISVSKYWMEALAIKYVKNKKRLIPSYYGFLINLIL